MSNAITGVIVRKSDQTQSGTRQVLVRASAFREDKAVSVSRQEYDLLQPGGLVSLRRVGWGPIAHWRVMR